MAVSGEVGLGRGGRHRHGIVEIREVANGEFLPCGEDLLRTLRLSRVGFPTHLRYVACLQRRAEENGGDLSDQAKRELRQGWYLGSDRFRDRLVNQIDAIKGKAIRKGSVSGAVVKAHKEADAERLIVQLGRKSATKWSEKAW